MRKTNFRKATLSALLMLVVAVVSLTGVTYAWFTSGNEANVNDINVSISDAEGGLLISTDNKTWKTTIEFGTENNELEPVSTVGDLEDDGDMKFFTAELASDPTYITSITDVTNDAEKKNGYFVEKDIYFNNYGGAEKKVSFSYTIAGDNDNAFVASRVALVFRGNITQDSYSQSTENFVDNGSGTVTIFEPYATTHTLMGKIDAAKAGISQENINGAYSYYGIKVAATGNVNRFGKEEQVGAEQTAPGYLEQVTTNKETSCTDLFTINADSFAKVTVYVWIEGQDYDCQNDISGYDFNLDLSFSVPETPSQGE